MERDELTGFLCKTCYFWKFRSHAVLKAVWWQKHEKLSYFRLKMGSLSRRTSGWDQIQMCLPQSLKYRFPDCDRNGHYPLFQKCIRELAFSIFSKESKQIKREDLPMVQEAASQTPLSNHIIGSRCSLVGSLFLGPGFETSEVQTRSNGSPSLPAACRS